MQDQVDHGGHESPADDDEQGALDPTLLPLLRIATRLYEVLMLGLEVGLNAWRLGLDVFGGEKESVGEREGDEARQGEDEDGEELPLE